MSITTTFVSGLSIPVGLAFDSSGYLYCTNLDNNNIIKITPEGVVSTFVNNDSGFSLAFDSTGNLYCANFNTNTIIKITPEGVVSTFVNNDSGLQGPVSLAFDSSGNLYCANIYNNTISKITPEGVVSTFVNNDSGLISPTGLAFDSTGNLYSANTNIDTISKITPEGVVSTFVSSVLSGPYSLAFDSNGNLYSANIYNNTISKITPEGVVSTFVSSGLSGPVSLAFDSTDNLYCSNSNNNTITKTTFIPTITTIINVQSSYTVTYGVSPFNLNATSNSPATITYSSSDPSIVSVNSSGLVTINTASNTPITITLNQAAIANYSSGDASANFIVNAANPTITNFSIPIETYLDTSFSIQDPSSNSTGAFSYTSSDTSVATISGNTVQIVGIGSSIITANQAATDDYTSGDISANLISNICFPAGTPINTDQGIIAIEKINPEIHTIRNKKIIGVTKTKSTNDFLVCIEKHALGNNIPSQKTLITRDHGIFYNGKMRRSVELIEFSENIYKVKYNGEILYNVLMEQHDKMVVNNLICETLNPENPIAKLYIKIKKCNPEQQERLIKEYNEFIIKNNKFSKKQLSRFI
jgi:sugar lactone lactonase YvrE